MAAARTKAGLISYAQKEKGARLKNRVPENNLGAINFFAGKAYIDKAWKHILLNLS